MSLIDFVAMVAPGAITALGAKLLLRWADRRPRPGNRLLRMEIMAAEAEAVSRTLGTPWISRSHQERALAPPRPPPTSVPSSGVKVLQ